MHHGAFFPLCPARVGGRVQHRAKNNLQTSATGLTEEILAQLANRPGFAAHFR